MEAYRNFAMVYDLFMEGTPYDDWMDLIENIWHQYNMNPKLVLDLGCGTGNMSLRLHERGYDTIGVDYSEEMLAIAKEKTQQRNKDILFLQQDMREFELYGTVDSIISVCDCINYITEEDDVLEIFKLVNNYLNPGGIFIFDINSAYKYHTMLGENTFAESFAEGAYIWENCFDEESKINEYYMNFFIKNDEGYYERFEETHYQKSYETSRIFNLLEKSGLKVLQVCDASMEDPPEPDCDRIYFIAQEISKQKS